MVSKILMGRLKFHRYMTSYLLDLLKRIYAQIHDRMVGNFTWGNYWRIVNDGRSSHDSQHWIERSAPTNKVFRGTNKPQMHNRASRLFCLRTLIK